MKFVSAILKILAALAFVAGAVYLLATYGDKIVAWAKKMIPCKCCEAPVPEAVEITTEEATEEAPVAEDTDFAAE